MGWTNEQTDAIYKKDSNILVAAAAGSGKTAVLVERIIQKIINDGVDIDKLLVVTFTNAAASEMRERVLEAIYKKLDEEPDNSNLQRQIILLGKSNISTIHSFCLDVIKNNFFEIDLSANFRIGTDEEMELLKQEVVDDLFDEYYEEDDEDFAKLIDIYASYRGDEALKSLVLNIYRFMQSSPFPKKWLEEKVELFNENNDKENDNFSDSIWGKIIVKDFEEMLLDSINRMKAVRNKTEKFYELDKFTTVLESDINKMKALYDKLDNSWDEAFEFVQEFKFEKWPTDKTVTLELKQEAKDARDKILKKVKDQIKNVLIADSKELFDDIYYMYGTLNKLKEVVFKFQDNFKQRKKDKNIIDFNDIEHYALKILVTEDGFGNYIPTDVAKKYQDKFVEIAIDEYQDSNQVQELILSTVSKGNNVFMVGDVKQSIYKFRQACPDLFLDKYSRYTLSSPNEDGLKIQLFKNFRSRSNVLDVTNEVFRSIMNTEIGDNIDYTEEEYLNLGASYSEDTDNKMVAELNVIDLNEDESVQAWIDDKMDFDSEEEHDLLSDEDDIRLEKEQLEAKYVVKKIREIIDSKMKVFDKKLGEREVTYKDIAILLRSTSKYAPIYERELIDNQIPVFSDSSTEYLDAIEIQTITSLLKIIDNPRDDISLVSVLRSEIGCFTDNEIVEIRLCDKTVPFYESLQIAREKLTGDLKGRLVKFLGLIDDWRKESEYLSLAELIWKIYTDTGYYNYVGLMTNGALRQANLKMLFERAKDYEKTSFKGLFNFIRFIERLKVANNDMSAAKVIGENENVVRIMSIHKSKGLEFPVVFLSSTAKKINLQDLTSKIVLHQKIGLGPQYINDDKKIEYTTFAKEAIKIVSKEEAIAEEMRVLYVALTRAREKLFITGISKDFNKDISKKTEEISTYKIENGKVPSILLKKYISYLDWIELVAICNKDINKVLKINRIDKKYITSSDTNEEKEVTIRDFNFVKEIDEDKYEDVFAWRYPNIFKTTMPLKTTVSKVKEAAISGIDFDSLFKKEIGIEAITPNFMKEDEELVITGARRGTLMHSFLEKIDFSREYSLSDLEDLKNDLVKKEVYTFEEGMAINLRKVDAFLKSDIAKCVKASKRVFKEEAFCYKMPAKEIYKDAKDEEILVQGIIDLYCINQDDTITLIDYKTDFVEEGNESILIERYKKQLEIYKYALQEGKGLKVKDIYIYSLYLNKAIKIEL